MSLQYNDLSRRLRVDALMRAFQLKNGNLNEIREESFDLEKTIQKIVESNLDSIFPDLEFLETEYKIHDLIPDTIAFDTEKRSFVIIEYKKIQSKSLVDQGVSYYQLLKDRKDNLVVLYHKKKGKMLDTSDVNWDETRVIFISPKYTKYQKRASGFHGLPIELYEIKKYQDSMITLNRISDVQSRDSSIQERSRPSEFSEEEYLAGKYNNTCPADETKKLWCSLKDKIEDAFEDIEFKQKKVYGGYYLKDVGSTICTLAATKHKINLHYSTNDAKLIETSEFIKDVSDIGKFGIGNFRSSIENEDDISRAMPFIRIVYDSKKQRGIRSD